MAATEECKNCELTANLNLLAAEKKYGRLTKKGDYIIRLKSFVRKPNVVMSM